MHPDDQRTPDRHGVTRSLRRISRRLAVVRAPDLPAEQRAELSRLAVRAHLRSDETDVSGALTVLCGGCL